MSVMLDAIRESMQSVASAQGRVVKEYKLPQEEIDAMVETLLPAARYENENPPPVDTAFGVKLTPNRYVRAVVFTDGHWALLHPGTLEWDKDSVFPLLKSAQVTSRWGHDE